ncbi:putative ribonuclease H-like domain-containing protein [Tanacetum coccineum]
MNYELVTTGNQTNRNAGIKDNVDAVPTQQYILLPLLSDSLQSSEDVVADDAGKKTTEEPANEGERNGQEKEEIALNKEGDQNVQDLRADLDKLFFNRRKLMLTALTEFLLGAYDDEDVGAKADLNNLEATMNVSHIPITRIHKDHPKDQIIGNINSTTQTRRMTKISKEHAKFPDKVYKVEKALYGLHQAPSAWYETLSTYLLENGFRRGIIDKTLFIKKEKGLEVMQRDDGIFISQDKYVADILKKFDFSSMKTTSTPIETNKALLKDEEAKDVDVYLYRSMIGSLMYLTASRPNIMFIVCACARFQVTPKVSHLQAVKRIFRYLKGQPKLGLWYPRDSPFNLEAFLDSDYVGASLDRKSTTGCC